MSDFTVSNIIFNCEPNNIYKSNLNEKITINIECMSDSLSILYFRNEKNEKIDIPNEIDIYTYDFQYNRVLLESVTDESYVLCYLYEYDIIFNGKKVINIKPQKVWQISEFNYL